MGKKQVNSPAKLSYLTAIKFLSKYISKHKRNFVMFYFGWFLDTVLSVAMPILFGIMVDEIVYYQNVDSFVKIALFFVTLAVCSCILYFLIYAQHHYLMSMYTFDIKRDVFEHLQKADAEYMSDAPTGDIISILQWYSTECMHFVIRNIIHLFNHCLSIVAIATYLFVINWEVGLVALLVTPISVFAGSFTHRGKESENRGSTGVEGVQSLLKKVQNGRKIMVTFYHFVKHPVGGEAGYEVHMVFVEFLDVFLVVVSCIHNRVVNGDAVLPQFGQSRAQGRDVDGVPGAVPEVDRHARFPGDHVDEPCLQADVAIVVVDLRHGHL